jgi:spore germination cell wall hydrolase CwlJ-like protein
MREFIEKTSAYVAIIAISIIPVVVWAILNVSTRPEMITVAIELPQPKPVIEIYEFGPDEDFPPPYNRFTYHDDDEKYIVDVNYKKEKTYTDSDLICMAKNIYFEARMESLKGQLAVGLVTLNRMNSRYFPNTVCGVVYQHAQFSWYWDGKSDRPKYPKHWKRSLLLASALLDPESTIVDFTHGSDHYHADYVDPHWRHNMIKVVKIDTHIFYRNDKISL